MHELHAILDAWRALADDEDASLATVVRVTGSAYRRPGARLYVTRACHRIGTISGGCLEAEVARKAWWATASGPAMRVYDTMSDDDAAWEFGLGCNGVIEILIERVRAPGCSEHLAFLQQQRDAGLAAVTATVIGVEPGYAFTVGDRLLLDETGVQGGALVGTDIESAVGAQARRALDAGQSAILHLEGVDLFVEVVAPPVPLVIFGAGDDARPLAAIATTLGWDVTVVDGRPGYATADRFPRARVVNVTTRDLLAGLAIDHRTIVVMMTHNYPFDRRLLPLVVAAEPAYVGILGPRARTERLFGDCGLAMAPTVHAPVGLDLGGDTPPAIALGIAAEMQAVVNRRDARMLRDRTVGIHVPLTEIGTTAIRGPRELAAFDGCAINACG